MEAKEYLQRSAIALLRITNQLQENVQPYCNAIELVYLQEFRLAMVQALASLQKFEIVMPLELGKTDLGEIGW